MKKRVLFLLLILLLSQLIFIYAQETPQIPEGLEDLQNIGEKTEGILSKFNNEESRNYLINEWKQMLLKNEFVSAMNSFFTEISPVFIFLFGESYSLSGTLAIIIFLWFFLFFNFGGIFSDFLPLSKIVAWILAFGLIVISAQLGILKKIAEFFVWLVFIKGGGIWMIIMLIFVIVAFILVYVLRSNFGKIFSKQKEQMKKQEREAKLEAGSKIAEGLLEGAKEGE